MSDPGVGIRAPGWHGQQSGKCAEAAIPDDVHNPAKASQLANDTKDVVSTVDDDVFTQMNAAARQLGLNVNLSTLPTSLSRVVGSFGIGFNVGLAFEHRFDSN